MKTNEEIKVQIDSFVDELIANHQTEDYNKVMSLLGGDFESDLDELLEEATEEQLQVVDKFMNPEINKTKRSDLLFIDPRLIKLQEGFNTRTDFGDLEELSLSIIENGVLNPLRGHKDGDNYILTDGERRYRAVFMALNKGIDIARVPFISEKKKSLEERIFDILLFNDGKTLTPLELGETYKRLVSYGYNYTEIAKKIGKTVKHVSDMVTVAGSGKEIKDLMKEGNVSATLVAEVKAKVKDNDEAEEIIKTVSELKKETSGGDKKKEKVTKKDVEDLLPEKPQKEEVKTETEEGEVEQQQNFTREEVLELLKKQIKACASDLPMNFKLKVTQTKLVI